jgi:hypothetical protein
MTLFLPILCTLICVSPCIVRPHLPDWQYPLSLRPRLFKNLRVWHPFVLNLTIVILRALISPVLLRCGMLCSRKHDYGQLLFTSPPPDTAYGNTHTLALIDHSPPRFPDSRVRENSLT